MQHSDPHRRTNSPPESFPEDRASSGAGSVQTLCHSQRRVPWRRRPKTEGELREILARAQADRQPVHIISTGKNWGFGSWLPARDDVAVIDLSDWQGIGTLDRATLSVRIEPGVTSGQLHRWLEREAPDLAFNVTGAGTSTSVIGCALERGLGYAGPMDDWIFGLEVMLADGSVHRPSPEWFHPARNHPCGPVADRLFFQSNYGIVLAARVRLRVRQEKEQAVVLNGNLRPMLETLAACYRDGLLVLPTHIAEPGRTGRLAANRLREIRGREVTPAEVAAVFPERNDHVGLAALHGRARVVDACWREIKRSFRQGLSGWRMSEAASRRLERIGRAFGLRNHADRLATFLPILGLTWGTPSDAGLQALDLPVDDWDADHARGGAIYGNGVSAVSGAAAEQISSIVREHWPTAACTYIVLNAHCLVTVFTLHFDPARAAEAKAAEKEIAHALRRAGFPPYRLGINLSGPSTTGVHARIKSALDPAGVIAPGRYES